MPLAAAGVALSLRTSYEHAHRHAPLDHVDAWLAYASRSKLTPFVKLARTIRTYRASVETTIEWRLTNGIAESNNASIGRLRTNARGLHTAQAFITMVMLGRAGIGPTLPWATAA